MERVATAKAITLRIPQLKDCKNHFDKKKEKGKGTMVFICEGQSAAGSITSCRDVNNQAVFVLKGKPLNVWDLKRDVMYKNDEMYKRVLRKPKCERLISLGILRICVLSG